MTTGPFLKEAVQLLEHLRFLRRLESTAAITVDHTVVFNACGDPYGCGCGQMTLDEVRKAIAETKDKLKNLPHVPNKAERKAARQKQAKQKKHRG